MPTKKLTLVFMKENDIKIKGAGAMSVSDLNKAVDTAVENLSQSTSKKWKQMREEDRPKKKEPTPKEKIKIPIDRFKVGEKVSFMSNKKLRTGEIKSINLEKRKVSVFIDDKDKEVSVPASRIINRNRNTQTLTNPPKKKKKKKLKKLESVSEVNYTTANKGPGSMAKSKGGNIPMGKKFKSKPQYDFLDPKNY